MHGKEEGGRGDEREVNECRVKDKWTENTGVVERNRENWNEASRDVIVSLGG